jgi:hypothetical protein
MRSLIFSALLLAVVCVGFHTLISASLAAARDAKAATFSERFAPAPLPLLHVSDEARHLLNTCWLGVVARHGTRRRSHQHTRWAARGFLRAATRFRSNGSGSQLG